MIEEFANSVPKSLLNDSGAVFYSGRCAFNSPSDLYILGSNPGGASAPDNAAIGPKNATGRRLSDNINFILRNPKAEHWSAYRDEPWNNRLQKGVLHLLKRIDVKPTEVPASEVVFLRSKSISELEVPFEQLAKKCWRFHQAVIDRLSVKVVVCIGKKAGEATRHRLKAYTTTDEFTESNGRGWESLTHRNRNGIYVVTLTHASQADWTKPASDPTNLVRRALIRTDTRHKAMYMERLRDYKPIRIEGEMISDTVVKMREESRY